MNDFERFKAAFEQPMPEARELPTPAKGDNGPRFAAVTAPVEHVAGLMETPAPKARAKKAASAKRHSTAPAEPLGLDRGMVDQLVAYLIEREAIRVRKEIERLPPPWTTDLILAAGHFCNVRRNDDKVTRWTMAHIIAPHRDDPDLWHKIVIARCVNEPDALAELDWSAPFDPQAIRATLDARQARGGTVYRTKAYKPPLPPVELKGMGITEYLTEYIWPPLWRDREELRPRDGDTLESFADRLRGYQGLGPFRAGQIIADLKHVAPLCHAADFRTFAVPGPGSLRGLNRICKRDVKASWSEAQWHATLLHLRSTIAPKLEAAGLGAFDAQDTQNHLCEFDKYLRAQEQGGKPSRKYQAAEAPAKRSKVSEVPGLAVDERRARASSKVAGGASSATGVDTPPVGGTEPPAAIPRTIEPESPTQPHCLAAALAYAARGWKLFPAPRGSKKSHRKAREGGERWGATRDPSEIRQDFARWPEANIGLPTDRDNGFWVLEADTLAGGHTHDGMASLQALMAQHGLLPQTRMAVSPSGSWHYYFKWPPGQTIRNSTSQVGPGLDVRGEGGMVIAPPSIRGDGAYRWISESEIAEAPAWLLDLVAAPKDDTPRTAAADAELLGPLCDIEAAVAVIANNDLDWESWNKIGMAIFAASGGSEEGFAAFDRFSAKSDKYDSDTTREKWQAFNGCPPDRIGFDFLASEAHKADPEWRLKAARANTAAASEAAPQTQQAQQAAPELISLRASDVDLEALEWLWPNRFARGKLGLIAGLPDEGKGLLTAYMAACCTDPEREWPCSEGKAPQGNVILFTAEDDIADTVAPRLVAAGANREHVHIIRLVVDTDKHGKPRRRMFSLRHDLEKLRAKIAELGNVVLIIIDPITAYLGVGEIDSYRDADVRAVLAPLQDLAAELHTAVIAIMHFNKKVDVLNLLLRVCNSIAFTAAARHAFGVVYDADNHRRLLVRGKNNLARLDDRALAFRVDAYEVGRDKRNGKPIEAPFLIWDADYVDITATEALQAVNENKAPGSRNTAKAFLRNMLRDGPVAVTAIEAARKAEGITKRTLDRAKAELGVVSDKDEGPNGIWRWRFAQQKE
jgi:hypothetical protein